MDIRFEHNIRTREFFRNLMDEMNTDELNKIPPGFSNNMIWNIIHSMTTQQGLTYGLSGLQQNVPKEIAIEFKNGTKPERNLTTAEIEDFKTQLIPLLDETQADYDAGKFAGFKAYTTSTGYVLRNIDDAINLINVHEGIHLGYCLALKKALKSTS